MQKGGNVLVTRDGRVKLADFGASKACSQATIKDGMKSILGSVFWLVRSASVLAETSVRSPRKLFIFII